MRVNLAGGRELGPAWRSYMVHGYSGLRFPVMPVTLLRSIMPKGDRMLCDLEPGPGFAPLCRCSEFCDLDELRCCEFTVGSHGLNTQVQERVRAKTQVWALQHGCQFNSLSLSIYIYICMLYRFEYIQVISKNIAHGIPSNPPNSVQILQAPVLRRWKTARVVEQGSTLSE